MRLSDIGNIRCKASTDITYPLPSRPTTIKLLYFPHFSIFFLFKKSKRLQKKSKLCPQKGKQASLKSKSFCAMLRKKRLKCGRIPVRLFLACHQKSNTFKCKQFCCAKPMCACLFMGCAPRPRERRAAVLSSRLSISCSAHSRANAPELERVRARASCFASRSALSKHSRLSPLERALCSLFFANIASLHPPQAALR